MTKLHCAVAISCLPLLGGCYHDDYSIEMIPRGTQIQRKLTVARLDRTVESGKPTIKYQAFPEERLKALAAMYRNRLTSENSDVHIFEDSFGRTMPSDVGGAGSYAFIATQMGTASAYLETFRGSDDLAAEFQRREKATDRLVDLWMRWLDERLSGRRDRRMLLQFIDVDLRHDLKNVALYAWLWTNETQLDRRATWSPPSSALPIPAPQGPGSTAHDTATRADATAEEQTLARLFAYLISRGYITEADMPVIARALSHPKEEDQLAAWALIVRRILEQKVGIEDKLTTEELLSLIHDSRESGKSLRAYLRNTMEYKAMLKSWMKGQEVDKESQAEEPDPMSVMKELAEQACPLGLVSSADGELHVSLAIDGQLVASNGDHDEGCRKLSWHGQLRTLETNTRTMSVLCYATWSRADESFQAEHFGKVVLSGQELQSYCLWYKSLAMQEAQEWDAFLACLEPDENLPVKLLSFHFSSDTGGATPPSATSTAPEETPRSYAEEALNPIRRALGITAQSETQPSPSCLRD
ncbi:MAG: hypothetical protein AB1714_08710 [Acidobacteriota bacterium]